MICLVSCLVNQKNAGLVLIIINLTILRWIFQHFAQIQSKDSSSGNDSKREKRTDSHQGNSDYETPLVRNRAGTRGGVLNTDHDFQDSLKE